MSLSWSGSEAAGAAYSHSSPIAHAPRIRPRPRAPTARRVYVLTRKQGGLVVVTRKQGVLVVLAREETQRLLGCVARAASEQTGRGAEDAGYSWRTCGTCAW